MLSIWHRLRIPSNNQSKVVPNAKNVTMEENYWHEKPETLDQISPICLLNVDSTLTKGCIQWPVLKYVDLLPVFPSSRSHTELSGLTEVCGQSNEVPGMWWLSMIGHMLCVLTVGGEDGVYRLRLNVELSDVWRLRHSIVGLYISHVNVYFRLR